MTYGCVAHASHVQDLEGAAVSHLAELVRGNCDKEGPLIRPFGPPSPQGEKGHAWLSQGNHNGGIRLPHAPLKGVSSWVRRRASA
jgi:hypothetical protein